MFRPWAVAAALSWRMEDSLSAMVEKRTSGNLSERLRNRLMAGPTSCEARRMSVAPAAAAISDSAMVAHLALVTPRAARRETMRGSLWVLR